MKRNSSSKFAVFLMAFLVAGLTGCQSALGPHVEQKKPTATVVKPDLPQLQPDAETEKKAAERAQWKIEAERKALAARKRAAEKARHEARKEARREAEEKRRRIAAEKQAEQERKRVQQMARKERAATLLKEIEAALDGGELFAAETKLDEYHQLLGNRALKQAAYQTLRQRVATMKRVFADMEQARVAEQYLLQLMEEAQVLQQQGKNGAARVKYGEVLALNPEHRGARDGIQSLLMEKTEESSAPKPKQSEKRSWQEQSTLLGKQSEGWVVQVATYPEDGKKAAYALLGTIKKAGFKAVFIKKQELAGRQLYRVRIGAYGVREEADAVSTQLMRKLATQDVRVASRVMRQKP